MNDPNHTWNKDAPILAEKQLCGCHIVPEIFELCGRGRDLKKSADSWYWLWQSQKKTPIDPAIIRAHLASFEIHRKAYLRHLETGKEWVL